MFNKLSLVPTQLEQRRTKQEHNRNTVCKHKPKEEHKTRRQQESVVPLTQEVCRVTSTVFLAVFVGMLMIVNNC